MILINGENKKKMILTRVVLIKFKNLTTTWAVDYLKRRKKSLIRCFVKIKLLILLFGFPSILKMLSENL